MPTCRPEDHPRRRRLLPHAPAWSNANHKLAGHRSEPRLEPYQHRLRARIGFSTTEATMSSGTSRRTGADRWAPMLHARSLLNKLQEGEGLSNTPLLFLNC
jgi:hypothetical protein